MRRPTGGRSRAEKLANPVLPDPPAVAASIATFVEDGLRAAGRYRPASDTGVFDLHYHQLPDVREEP